MGHFKHKAIDEHNEGEQMQFGGKFENNNKEFEVLPKGRYACKMINCVIEQTATGTDYILLEFDIVDGDSAGRKIWHKLWMTEKAYNMSAQQLNNIMVFSKIPTTDSIETFMRESAKLVFELVGKKFEVSVTGHNEWNGKEYPNTILTHYLDTPNAAVQVIANSSASKDASSASDEIPF